VAITIISSELRGVLERLFGAPVELQEKSEARLAASITPVAVRSEATARAGRGTAPLLERLVPSACSRTPRSDHERHKQLVSTNRVGEVSPEPTRARIAPQQPMMSRGGRWR